MIACPHRHPFLLLKFLFTVLTISFDLLPTYHHQGLIARTLFFLLCRFIIQILMRCLVPCVWTSSTKLGRHYMISQIFLRASSLNSSLIPIPQIRSMGTQQPCIFTGMNVKKSWMMISDCSVLNSGSFRPCKICYLQNFLILKNLWSYFSHFSRYFF